MPFEEYSLVNLLRHVERTSCQACWKRYQRMLWNSKNYPEIARKIAVLKAL